MAIRRVYMIHDPATGLYSNGIATRKEVAFVPFENGTIFESLQKVNGHIKRRSDYQALYEGCVVVEFTLVEP